MTPRVYAKQGERRCQHVSLRGTQCRLRAGRWWLCEVHARKAERISRQLNEATKEA